MSDAIAIDGTWEDVAQDLESDAKAIETAIETPMTIHQRLWGIQTHLRVGKTNTNNFGGYKYRTLDDINAAVRPLLEEFLCTLTYSDDLVMVGDRYYIKATVTLTAVDTLESVTATAYAREEQVKKGMDQAQITGSASTYARKYAAAGLFALTGNDDPDEHDNTDTTQNTVKPGTGENPRVAAIQSKLDAQGITGNFMVKCPICHKGGGPANSVYKAAEWGCPEHGPVIWDVEPV